jgi:hypothetical protein
MAYVIPALAVLLSFISFALFLFSGFTQKHLYFFFDHKWANVVIVFRVFAGFVVIAAAPASGAPMLMILVGIAILFVAITSPFMSDQNLTDLADWWLSLSPLSLKLWGLSWMVIWLLIAYISLPGDSAAIIYLSSLFSQYLF